MRINPAFNAKRGSVPTTGSLGNFATTQAFGSNIRKSNAGEEPNDWRISLIEPKEAKTPATPATPMSPSDNPSEPKKVKKFVGMHQGSDMMISAIGQDKIGLPG